MSKLAFLFIFIIAILMLGLSLVSSILRAIFGLGGRTVSSAPKEKVYTQPEDNEVHRKDEIHAKIKKKFKEEGEYVDFEEVREEE